MTSEGQAPGARALERGRRQRPQQVGQRLRADDAVDDDAQRHRAEERERRREQAHQEESDDVQPVRARLEQEALVEHRVMHRTPRSRWPR
jgi:hypothetical protein